LLVAFRLAIALLPPLISFFHLFLSILFPLFIFFLLPPFAVALTDLQSIQLSRLRAVRHASWPIRLLPSWLRWLVLHGEPFHLHLEAFISISLSAFL
jgi:hypothetical protein